MISKGRDCGDCIACCTYLKISSLPKKALTHCPHVELLDINSDLNFTGKHDCATGKGNCKIYDSRPSVCQGYKCMWLFGYGDEEDRPDKSGVLIDRILPIENCLQAKPIKPGAQDTEEGRGAVERISRDAGCPVAVASFPETSMVRIVGRGIE